MTLWMPAGTYIANTTEHEDVARAFLAFIASVEGTEAQTATAPHRPGRTWSKAPRCPTTCCRRSSTSRRTSTPATYGPALEFVSPLKGPNLEHITVEVGSGLRSAEDAAALYDEDVEKQAQQLGLPGW